MRLYGRPPRPVEETGPALDLLVPHFYKSLASGAATKMPMSVALRWKGLAHGAGMLRLIAEMRGFRPDIVHFQWSALPMVDRRVIPRLRRVAKTVLTVHDSTPFNGTPRAGARLSDSVAVMQAFDRLIVHTENALGRLVAYGISPAKIRVVPHGLLDHYAAIRNDTRRHREARVVILMFGYMKPYKGIDVLLRAAGMIRQDVLDKIQIRIVGKPFMDVEPLQNLIRELGLASHVKLEPGFVPDEAVGGLFAQADVVVLPYREIDASGVLMTAIACGVPVVGSRLGLAAEILEDGRHALLVRAGDAHGLAKALEAVVADDALRLKMREHMLALLGSIPSWDEIARQTLLLYDELLLDR